MQIKIPVYKPSLTGKEKEYVNQCLDSTWISSKGEFISRFEKSFAEYIGVNYAASVSNGTVALHLALITLGIGEGDEVIVPTLTYIASVNSITYTGAKPVFVDSLKDTWQIDPEDIRRKITPRTKAIMAVHLYGHPCEMDEIVKIAQEHKIFLIEDVAEAFGTKYKGRMAGSFGDISTFSFFGNKTITTGEGGMVITNDVTLHERAMHFKGQGLAKYREYWHDVVGYNYRMTNICAAIGLAQLERAEELIAKKRNVAELYNKHLKGIPVLSHQESPNTFHTYWMYSILTLEPKHREPLRDLLKENGIETRPFFYPVHTMPMYAQKYQRHAIAEDLATRGINLPSSPELTEAEIIEIAGVIKKYFQESK